VLLENFECSKMRGHGFRLGVDHVTVENCNFHEIVLEAFVPWNNPIEGSPPEDLTVRNCRIKDVYYWAENRFPDPDERTRVGGIRIRPKRIDHELPEDYYRDHTYENNTFEDMTPGVPAFHLNWISDVTITDNDFGGVDARHPVWVGPKADCDSIRVDGRSGCRYTDDRW
jgi:hypothetical protein